jgi:predicted small lipoprotein YifL
MRIAVLLTAAGAALLAGCGQKGALYLPEKNTAPVTAPAAPAAPAPAAPAAAAAPAPPAGTATPSATPPQTAPPPAPQKKQNADDDSQK